MSLNQSDIEAFIKAANDREQKTTLFFGIVKTVQDATITVETRSGDLIYAISYVYANVGDQVACLSRGTSIVAFAAKDAEALKSSISETVDSVSFQYLQTSSSSETPQGNWSDTAPEWQDGKYMWQRSKTVKSDGSISYGDPVCLSGSTGATGAKGEKGADGRGISVVSSVYQLSDSGTEQPSGEWSDEPLAQTDALPYLWVRNLVIYTDGTSDSFYSVSAKGDKGSQGDQGIQGIKGADGSSSYLHIAYATSEDGRSGFSTYDSTGKTYIGQYVDENPLDSEEYTKYSWSLIKGDKGDKGDTGDTGNGIRDITQYYLATASGSDVTISTKGWTTAIQTITAAKKYLWNFEKVTYTDGTESTSTPVIIGVYGDTGAKGDKGDKGATGADGATGNGIASIAEHYQVSSSSSTTPTTWQSTVPTMTATNKYLWNYETVTYTDGTTSDTSKRVIGAYGDTGAKGATGETGKGIKSTAITYQVGSSGTSAPTGTWVATVQATSTGQYLWTRTVTTYTDNSVVTSYSVAAHGATGSAGKNGTDGTSVTIKSQAVTYASSTSGTDTPTSWQTSIPVVAAGSYLWTRTIVTYSDGTSTTGYSVARQGSDGKDGSNGTDGKDGTAIFATCSTASSTSAKVATIVSGTLASLTKGATVTVSFASGNTASAPTLKVGSTAAKPIMCNGTNAAYWEAGNVMFTYDGTYWQVCSAAIYGKTATIGNPNGSNILLNSSGISMRNGSDVGSIFSDDEARIGKSSSSHVSISTDSVSINNGSTELSKFFSDNSKTFIKSSQPLYLCAGSYNSSTGVRSYQPVYFTLPPDEATSSESDIGVGLVPDGSSAKFYCGASSEFADVAQFDNGVKGIFKTIEANSDTFAVASTKYATRTLQLWPGSGWEHVGFRRIMVNSAYVSVTGFKVEKSGDAWNVQVDMYNSSTKSRNCTVFVNASFMRVAW